MVSPRSASFYVWKIAQWYSLKTHVALVRTASDIGHSHMCNIVLNERSSSLLTCGTEYITLVTPCGLEASAVWYLHFWLSLYTTLVLGRHCRNLHLTSPSCIVLKDKSLCVDWGPKHLSLYLHVQIYCLLLCADQFLF